MTKIFIACLLLLGACATHPTHYSPSLDDKYNWLVERDSARVQQWVRAQNELTQTTFASGSRFTKDREEILEIRNRAATLPTGQVYGKYLYKVLKGDAHPRGLWRRILIADLVSKRETWRDLLDLDALSKKDKTEYSLSSTECLEPQFTKCLLLLAVAGADHTIIREFDVETKSFVEGGFRTQQPAMNGVQWIDKDEIFVTSDFGPGTVSKSTYPRQVRIWKRGEQLSHATLVYEAKSSSTGAFIEDASRSPRGVFFIGDFLAFRDRQYSMFRDGKLTSRLETPLDAELIGLFGDEIVFKLGKPWQRGGRSFDGDSVISLNLNEPNNPSLIRQIYAPAKDEVIGSVDISQSALWIRLLKNVTGRLLKITRSETGWNAEKIQSEFGGSFSLMNVTPYQNSFFVDSEDFLEPEQLYYFDGRTNSAKSFAAREKDFDARGLTSEIHWTTSRDGTAVPYFMVHRKGVANDGNQPTLIYGYGAANDIESPWYLGAAGKEWVEKGGVFVSAVLRGGGEFGTQWWREGAKENKQHTFDDFIAIAEDLIRTKITNPKKLGIYGSSWGGLLVSAVAVQRPDLFAAVAPQMPMEDMLNFPLLPIGDTWTGEFGDPTDPVYEKVLRGYSPYHNVKASDHYPAMLFISSTNDDRMHPAHARRMVAKMQDQGHPVYYYESNEGGHRGSSTNEKFAFHWALTWVFFQDTLSLQDRSQPTSSPTGKRRRPVDR